jgi:hypothetical protein
VVEGRPTHVEPLGHLLQRLAHEVPLDRVHPAAHVEPRLARTRVGGTAAPGSYGARAGGAAGGVAGAARAASGSGEISMYSRVKLEASPNRLVQMSMDS